MKRHVLACETGLKGPLTLERYCVIGDNLIVWDERGASGTNKLARVERAACSKCIKELFKIPLTVSESVGIESDNTSKCQSLRLQGTWIRRAREDEKTSIQGFGAIEQVGGR